MQFLDKFFKLLPFHRKPPPVSRKRRVNLYLGSKSDVGFQIEGIPKELSKKLTIEDKDENKLNNLNKTFKSKSKDKIELSDRFIKHEPSSNDENSVKQIENKDQQAEITFQQENLPKSVYLDKPTNVPKNPYYKRKILNGKRNYLLEVVYVVYFIKKLKHKVSERKLKKLNSFHFKLIQDATNFRENKKIKQLAFFLQAKENICKRYFSHILKNFRHSIKNLFSRVKVLEPNSRLLVTWSVILLLCLAINLFYLCLDGAFKGTILFIPTPILILCRDLPTIMLIINSLLKINTAFYSKGEYIKERRKIIKNYFQSQALLDSFIIIPYFITLYFDSTIIQLLLLLRWKTLKQIFLQIERDLNFRDKAEGYFRLFILLFTIVFIAHFFACSWIYLGSYEMSNLSMTNWITSNGLEISNPFPVYINALYFSTVTMITVGYGDMSPVNLEEKIFGIFFLLLSCGVFAFSLNSIGIIIQRMYYEEDKFKKQLSDVEFYLDTRRIRNTLKFKIKRYLEYVFEEKRSTASHVRETLFEELSDSLRKEFVIDYYGSILKKNEFFSKFSSEFINTISYKFDELTLAPDELLMKEGEESKYIYFVLTGQIQLYLDVKDPQYRAKKMPLNILKNHEGFGYRDLLLRSSKSLIAKSIGVSTVAVLLKEDFLEDLEHFVLDKELFCSLRDSISDSRFSSESIVKCLFCNEPYHHIFHCQVLPLNFNETTIISKERKANFQMRKFGEKRRKETFRVFKRKGEVLSSLERLYEALLQDMSKNNNIELFEGMSDSEHSGSEIYTESEKGRNSQFTFQTPFLNSPNFLQVGSDDPIIASTYVSQEFIPLNNSNSSIPIIERTSEAIYQKNSLISAIDNIKARRPSFRQSSYIPSEEKERSFSHTPRHSDISPIHRKHRTSIRPDTSFSAIARNSINIISPSHNQMSSGSITSPINNVDYKPLIELKSLILEESTEGISPKKEKKRATEPNNELDEESSIELAHSLNLDIIKNYTIYCPNHNIDVIADTLLLLAEQKLIKRRHHKFSKLRSYRAIRKSLIEGGISRIGKQQSGSASRITPQNSAEGNIPKCNIDMRKMQSYLFDQDSFGTFRTPRDGDSMNRQNSRCKIRPSISNKISLHIRESEQSE